MGFLIAAGKALPLVLLGLFANHLLSKDAETSLPALAKGCPQVMLYPWRFGIEAADTLLCILVQFFKASLSTSEGQWTTGHLLFTLNSVFAFMAVEASRYGSGWLLSLLPIHAFLFQIKGISVVLPLVWLPLYFLYGGDDRSKYSKQQRKVSIGRVVLIALGLLVFQFVFVGLGFPLEDLLKETFILAFQFAPVLVPLLWLPIRTTEKTPQVAGHKAIIALHLLQAGAGLLWQAVSLVFLVADPGVVFRVYQTLIHTTPDNWARFVLAVDLLILFLALVYVAMVQEGILIGLLLTLLALAVGPAASLSLYFAYREQLISSQKTE